MRLLVCGGAGFIGTNFIYHMLNTYLDISIVAYDKLTYAGNFSNLAAASKDPRFVFVQGDITDAAQLHTVISTHQIEYMINFAAETHVDRSIHNGAKDFILTNTLGVQILLDAARFFSIKKFVHVSTDEVYGSLQLSDTHKFTEDSPIRPNMPYAAAKAGGDLLCGAYWATYRTPVIVTHCSNNYGPYQFPEKIIPYFVCKLLQGENVPLYGDGQHVRDWIHVSDHVRALDLLLQKGQPGQTYNIGANNERSNLEITRMLLAIFRCGEERIEYVADRPGHDRRYAIDATKMLQLDWEPQYPRERFEQGLQEVVAWYKQNTSWVEQLWKHKRVEMNDFQTAFQKSLVQGER